MQENQWQKIEEVFNRAAVLPEAERRALIRNLCRDDEKLYREVLLLIEADAEEKCFLDEPNFDLGLEVLAGGRAGTLVSHYSILRLLGQGGMGEVYLARDTESGQNVALKLLGETATKDADRIRRFRQEARAASLIRHESVARVYEIGEFENIQFIAMEYVDGETLRERLKSDSFTFGEALTIAGQIVSALGAAHALSIIHRDLKPENVMIDRHNQVKVLDFGLAKLTKTGALQSASKNATAQANLLTESNSTAFGMVFGTAGYMSPEQARGQKTDERTDIWSFGVLLYEMLAGKAPFRGKTNLDVIAAVLTAQPQPLKEISPVLPNEISDLVDQTLQKEKEERPDLQQIADKLRLAREQLGQNADLKLTRLNNSALNEQRVSNSPETTPGSSKTANESQTLDILKIKNRQKLLPAVLAAFIFAALGITVYLSIRPDAPTAKSALPGAAQTDNGTNNSEVEREYQKGIYIWSKRKIEDMPQALAHFQKAIELDPGFAKAYVGLANAYQWDGNPKLTREEKQSHVKAALQRALAINPNSVEARSTLAFTLGVERNWHEAEREYLKALEIDPNYPTTHIWYAEFLALVKGEDDKAIEHIDLAHKLDPLSFAVLSNSVAIYYFVGRYDEAIAKAEKMIAFDSRFEIHARAWMARLYAHKGDIGQAKKEFKRYDELSNEKLSNAERGNYLSLFGEREKALEYIKKVENSSEADSIAIVLASSYSHLNMTEEAIKWLEIAFDNENASITTIAASPDFDNLHTDPRFINLLARINMADFWRAKFSKQ